MAESGKLLAKLQRQLYKRGARVDEYFHDFDKLRTGHVSKAQFARCIGQLGLDISRPELDTLADIYQGSYPDQVAYRQFVIDVNSIFTKPELEKAPTQSVQPVTDHVKPEHISLEPELEDVYNSIVQDLKTHCKKYGLSLRECFKDFDKVNRGLVTRSQFERNLPRAPSFEPVHMAVLFEKLKQEDVNLIDYLTLHREVEGISVEAPKSLRHTLRAKQPRDDLVDTSRSVDELLQQLKVFFHKARVRALHFFSDYDKLRSSYITPNQFVCGLSLACTGPAGERLSRNEMQQIADHYSSDRGVNYRQFCNEVDAAFLTGQVEDLAIHPTADPAPLTRTQLVRETAGSDKSPELQALIDDLHKHVSALRLDPYPQFREFDRRHGFTKGVSPSQFHRLLDMTLKRHFTEAEVKLLCDYYHQPSSEQINYHAFLADVDPATRLQQTDQLYFDTTTLRPASQPATDSAAPEPMASEEAKAQVQACLLRRGLRATEHLRDFDKLRKGYITKAQFHIGIKAMMPSASQPLLDGLTQGYTDQSVEGPCCVVWRQFAREMDDVFCQTNELEKAPKLAVASLDQTVQSLLSTSRVPQEQTDELALAYEQVMDSLRNQVKAKVLDPKPSLTDFDPNRKGSVTKTQFQQSLCMSGFKVSDKDMALLAWWHKQDERVNYVTFLEALAPSQPSLDMASMTQRNMRQLAQDRAQVTQTNPSDVNDAMRSLQRQVLERRIRLQEHIRDFDKLRAGYVTKSQFRSGITLSVRQCGSMEADCIFLIAGLSMCSLLLPVSDLKAIERAYTGGSGDKFEYRRFCRDLDSVFATDGLHLDPLREVNPPPSVGSLAAFLMTCVAAY
eukprot:TRINITY_DN10595_c0_g1_i1.p1 TRINITY_DN10595_c0_g1~~TRINITY_DN10595_c0_g1_i1.p1  ORF type:complete len:844 (+),score=153.32 TRINITY_DN10595_c0_g1_i1:1-2532(+)